MDRRSFCATNVVYSDVWMKILSRPVPRPVNARVHLANPRRLLVGAGIGSVILLVLGAALVVLTGLHRAEFEVHHFMVFAFFGLLGGVVPLWQLLNNRRARRVLRYGTIVPATLSFGTPTRGHHGSGPVAMAEPTPMPSACAGP